MGGLALGRNTREAWPENTITQVMQEEKLSGEFHSVNLYSWKDKTIKKKNSESSSAVTSGRVFWTIGPIEPRTVNETRLGFGGQRNTRLCIKERRAPHGWGQSKRSTKAHLGSQKTVRCRSNRCRRIRKTRKNISCAKIL